MTRKFKVLGLALVAVLSVAAVTASAASAESTKFTAAKYPTTLTGSATTKHVFEIGEFKVICSVVKTTGALSGASETTTLTPVYEECEALGLKAEVKPNGCDYKFHAPLVGSEEGSVDVVCPEGKQMEIIGATCTITITAQQELKHVQYINTFNDIDIHETLTSMHATIVRDSILCPLETSTISTVRYTGDTTLQGSSAIDFG
jgi:hypothetical protein